MFQPKTEDPFIEVGRARDVVGGHLDVTDLPIRERRRHRHSFLGVAILAAIKLKAIPHYPPEINYALENRNLMFGSFLPNLGRFARPILHGSKEPTPI